MCVMWTIYATLRPRSITLITIMIIVIAIREQLAILILIVQFAYTLNHYNSLKGK